MTEQHIEEIERNFNIAYYQRYRKKRAYEHEAPDYDIEIALSKMLTELKKYCGIFIEMIKL